MSLPTFIPKTDDVDDVLASHVNDIQTVIEAIAKGVGLADYVKARTLTTDEVSLTDTDTPVQKLDSNGATRNIYLPAPSTDNHPFYITNVGAFAVSVKNNSTDATEIASVGAGEGALVFSDSVAYKSGGGNVTTTGTQTLTNKRITKRVASTTDDATAVIDSDSYDEYYLTAIANATEISVTGTPTAGQTIFIGLKDAGVSKALTWTGITALGVTLPTATTAGKQHVIGVKYIAAAWRAIAVGVEA